MPSRFAFPRIRRFHPHDTTNEDSARTDHNDIVVTTTSTTTTPTSSDRRTRTRDQHEHRRHSRHHSSSSPSSPKPPSMMGPMIHPPIQNFRLRWIDHDHEECAVCTKKFEINCVVTLLPCGHYFCQPCMDQWFWKIHSSTCPLCRYDVAAVNPCDEDDDEVLVDCTDDDENEEVLHHHHHHHHAITEKRNNKHLATATNSTEYLSLVTKVVLTGDMSDAKCEKLSDTLACDGVASSFGTNFDLIMAKALHARRARMAYEMTSSSMMDSFILDNQD